LLIKKRKRISPPPGEEKKFASTAKHFGGDLQIEARRHHTKT